MNGRNRRGIVISVIVSAVLAVGNTGVVLADTDYVASDYIEEEIGLQTEPQNEDLYVDDLPEELPGTDEEHEEDNELLDSAGEEERQRKATVCIITMHPVAIEKHNWKYHVTMGVRTLIKTA